MTQNPLHSIAESVSGALRAPPDLSSRSWTTLGMHGQLGVRGVEGACMSMGMCKGPCREPAMGGAVEWAVGRGWELPLSKLLVDTSEFGGN